MKLPNQVMEIQKKGETCKPAHGSMENSGTGGSSEKGETFYPAGESRENNETSQKVHRSMENSGTFQPADGSLLKSKDNDGDNKDVQTNNDNSDDLTGMQLCEFFLGPCGPIK